MRTNTSLTLVHAIYMVVIYSWLGTLWLDLDAITRTDNFLLGVQLMLLLRNWELIHEWQQLKRQSQAALEEAFAHLAKGVRL